MFIVYQSSDEILVTTESRELAFLNEFFGPDVGRWVDTDTADTPGVTKAVAAALQAREVNDTEVVLDQDIYTRTPVDDVCVAVVSRMMLD